MHTMTNKRGKKTHNNTHTTIAHYYTHTHTMTDANYVIQKQWHEPTDLQTLTYEHNEPLLNIWDYKNRFEQFSCDKKLFSYTRNIIICCKF